MLDGYVDGTNADVVSALRDTHDPVVTANGSKTEGDGLI
jgi:hypothetical protein